MKKLFAFFLSLIILAICAPSVYSYGSNSDPPVDGTYSYEIATLETQIVIADQISQGTYTYVCYGGAIVSGPGDTLSFQGENYIISVSRLQTLDILICHYSQLGYSLWN